MFSTFDLSMFRFLNGLTGRSAEADAAVVFGATYLIFVMLALAIGYVAVGWKTTHFEGRIENVTHALWAATIGFLIETIIGFIWFRARPFAAFTGVHVLVDRLPTEKSFPSAHATIAFSLAFAVYFHNKKWGRVLLILAVVVALARVAAGVHFPSDVLGGMLVGLLAAKIAAPVKNAMEPYLDLFSVFRNNKRLSV
jgi:undecaprenyl-diphosphatase